MRIIAMLLALQSSLMMSGAFAASVSDPVVTVSGLSTSQQTVAVTVTDTTAGATITYATDGTNPTAASPSIPSGTTLLIAPNTPFKFQAFVGTSGTITSDLVTEQFGVGGMVSAGSAHTLALKNDGTVWAWGDNSAGELGNGTTTNSSTPVQVMMNGTNGVQPLTGVVAVAADNDESFAVDSSGNVWAWGLNSNGQLGLETYTNTIYATQISSLSGIVGIASCQYHTLAVRNDGSVWAWGVDSSGQVGNGNFSAWITEPTEVLAPSGETGYLGEIVAVAAGASHSLALDQNGDVWAWGSNSSGQLGNGDTSLTSQSVPVLVGSSHFTGAVSVAAGTSSSFALKGNGSTWAWGDNTIGELGNGTVSPASPVPTANLTPAQVSGSSGMSGTAIVAVGNQTALGSNGTVWGWGDNTDDRLGVDFAGSFATLPLIVSLSTGSSISLAITSGSTQTDNDGAFAATPLTINATSSGQAATGALIDFISEGSGLLSASISGSALSGIIQMTTNSSGQASVYYKSPSSGSGANYVEATTDHTQSSPFTITLTGVGVAIQPWAYVSTILLMLVICSSLLPKKPSAG